MLVVILRCDLFIGICGDVSDCALGWFAVLFCLSVASWFVLVVVDLILCFVGSEFAGLRVWFLDCVVNGCFVRLLSCGFWYVVV